MAHFSFTSGFLGLISLVGALRLDRPENSHNAIPMEMARDQDVEGNCMPPGAYRQQLSNMMDLQYFTEVTLGGQRITGILDTGSFELVVFSRQCMTCGRAGAFDADRSPTFIAGDQYKEHAYGSGSCRSREGTDEVALGCYKSPNQAIWLAVDCKMQLLMEAGFQSIVGVGPPGQPEFTARETLRQLEEMASSARTTTGYTPKDIQSAMVEATRDLEDALKKKSLLEGFGMRTFSTCLGRKPGLPGWMIWNDITREGRHGVAKVPVMGNITWGIALEGLSMEVAPSVDTDVHKIKEIAAGCEQGCGAVVDTGTSLISVPSTAYKAIASVLESHVTASDCSDLRNFPTLIIKVAGHKLRLPPSSYIGSISGEPSVQVAQYMHLDKRPQTGAACQLLLMDLGMEKTQFGPMVILGMPLFREYYTTFDLGSGRGHRSIFLTPADEACEPELGGKVKYNMNRAEFTPRHVDLSKVRVPEWLSRRSSVAV